MCSGNRQKSVVLLTWMSYWGHKFQESEPTSFGTIRAKNPFPISYHFLGHCQNFLRNLSDTHLFIRTSEVTYHLLICDHLFTVLSFHWTITGWLFLRNTDAISALHIHPRATLPQKALSPVHPHLTSFLGAPVLYWLKQSLRTHLILSQAKSCGYHWKWVTVLNSQGLAWNLCAKPPVSVPQASSWGCDSCEGSSVVLSGCKGTQLSTCRHLQSQRGPKQGGSAKSPMLPTTQMFPECWMQETLGWGEWVATLRLNLLQPTLRICLCVCVANHKLSIQPLQSFFNWWRH